jgi:hypothetical protein
MVKINGTVFRWSLAALILSQSALMGGCAVPFEDDEILAGSEGKGGHVEEYIDNSGAIGA